MGEELAKKDLMEVRAQLGFILSNFHRLGQPRLEHLLHMPAVHAYCCFRLGRGCAETTIRHGLDTCLRVTRYHQHLPCTFH